MINKIVIIIDDQHTTYLNCIWRDVLTWGFNRQIGYILAKQSAPLLGHLLFPKNTVVVQTKAQPC